MKIFRFGLMVAVAFAAFTVPAKADYNVWTDAQTGATVTFPDTWKQVTNATPVDLITLSVPSGDDDATCRLRAEEDKRFLIYPNKFRSDIRDIYFSNDFWAKYATNYDNVNILKQQDNAGLGQGFASMTLASYTTPPSEIDAGDGRERGGIMAVTNYYDKVYIAECSSSMVGYSKYHIPFLSFFKSISFKKSYHELAVGEYRNFLSEWGIISVPFPNTVSRTSY